MYYNIEIYSGVISSSEICRNYIYPEVSKFMDNESISQDKKSIVGDKIEETIDAIILEYHKKMRSAIEQSLNNRFEDIAECQVNLVSTNYYDIYITPSEEKINEDLLVSRCMDIIDQSTGDLAAETIDSIKESTNTVIKDELNKSFKLNVQLNELIIDMEVIEVHSYN